MAAGTLQMFREVGFVSAELRDVSTGCPPAYGEIPGPEGSPVVVLYAHYDVQPASPEQGGASDPWTPTRKDDGRSYGRGASDDKGGLAIHLFVACDMGASLSWMPLTHRDRRRGVP